jgi:hypothetical protein
MAALGGLRQVFTHCDSSEIRVLTQEMAKMVQENISIVLVPPQQFSPSRIIVTK